MNEKKINFMKIAANLCGFNMSIEQMDLIVSLYEAVSELKGELNVEQIAKIQANVKEREYERNRDDLLNKVSKKVEN